jgi:tRNA(fMet)-specific endonuclease VapC
MTVSRYVLDSNIITAILQKEQVIAAQIAVALRSNAEFLICPVVFYEVYRGLLYRDAKKQLPFFLQYVSTCTWEDITQDDWKAAAQRWAEVRGRGYQTRDADLLIAIYADRRGAVVVTDNFKHFDPLGVQLESWRR